MIANIKCGKDGILGKGDVVWTYCACGEHVSECESRVEFIHDEFRDWHFSFGDGWDEYEGDPDYACDDDLTDLIEESLVDYYIEDNYLDFLNTFGVQWKRHEGCGEVLLNDEVSRGREATIELAINRMFVRRRLGCALTEFESELVKLNHASDVRKVLNDKDNVKAQEYLDSIFEMAFLK